MVKSQKKLIKNSCIAKKYFNPDLPGCFSGISGFRRENQLKPGGKWEEWFPKQDAYTLHKPIRRRFMRRKTIVSGINAQWQIDLVDLSRLSSYNDGYKFVLTAIDVFSKVGSVRHLKNKTSSEVIKALDSIFNERGRPGKLQSDKGSEFRNASVQQFLKEHGVHHFVSENDDVKCSIVERWHRTILEKLYRYFTKSNSRRYLEALPRLVSAYNKSYHRSIGTSPFSVSKENEEKVWQRLYGATPQYIQSVKGALRKGPKVGDTVRLSETRREFKKGYLGSWTTETFLVIKVLQTTPKTYRIQDESGEQIKGAFYKHELQVVQNPPDKLYKIEKVLQRKGKRVLVRWEGYPPSFDSWVSAKAVENV